MGVNSGTSGLHLCVIAAGVGAGDLVITTPFSFIASANCILYERAIPVFVDVDPQTGNIDPAQVAEAAAALLRAVATARGNGCPPVLREQGAGPGGSGRLKAILPVHAFGQPADMDPLLEIARKSSSGGHRGCLRGPGRRVQRTPRRNAWATRPSLPSIPTSRSPPAKAA